MGCGVSAVPVAAWVAAGLGGESVCVVGEARAFLAPLPLTVLEPDARVLGLLEGIGVETCAALAALEREAVEVRFGGAAVELWRHARGEDERRLFGRPPVEQRGASLDFVDYVVTDPERLLFTANALLGPLCDALREGGLHARRIALTLQLANGASWRRVLRPARPTASRTVWLRLIRAVFEQLTVPDSIAGMAVDVESTERASAVQGDLFDAGFATASAVEAAIARLLETVGEVVVEPAADAHPLAERRNTYAPVALARTAQVREPHPGREGLTLQLLPEPKPIAVETVRRRDHQMPVRYSDGSRWRQIVTAAGPDRVSGGQWDQTYAREYFRAVGADGVLVWLFRDARGDGWYLHGYWD